jgi:type I restriction enzyme M protein
MVLHGDGSAHIFKYDALKPLPTYADDKLKPLSDPHRSIPKSRYNYDVAETFDVVVSNPPFGITVSSSTKISYDKTYSLKSTSTSESIFLERWFQLLKPGGRLGVVIPESLLNTTDSAEARLFLYRCFWIRAIVGLPRNLFIDTPTLTSLLFAQKKSKEEIEAWDIIWTQQLQLCIDKVAEINATLRNTKRENHIPSEIEGLFLEILSPIIDEHTWILKRGDAPLTTKLPINIETTRDACDYYIRLVNLAGFQTILRNYVFQRVVSNLNYEYPVYIVDEVGYKLGKRKERARTNQLCRLVDENTQQETPNLHLANGSVEIKIDTNNPHRVLDFIRRDVQWT